MRQIESSSAPEAVGPYSQAIEAGNMLFVSGQLPIDRAKGEIPDSIEAQTGKSIENARAVLEAAGLSLRHVVRAVVYLADLSDFSAMNAVYEEFFEPPYPARCAFQVAALLKGAKVEIEMIAVREEQR